MPPIHSAYASFIKGTLQAEPDVSGPIYNPMHAELLLTAFVGDHDPAHAQRLVFRLRFHLPRKSTFVTDFARELRRRHRQWLYE
jgi:hypothetical protein